MPNIQKLIILDTETTGVDKLRQPVEVAYVSLGHLHHYETGDLLSKPVLYTFNQRFKPTIPIGAGAFRIHGISAKVLIDCSPFKFADLFIPETVEYMVAHNAQFDYHTIGNPGNLKTICTISLMKKLYPEIGKYSLGHLIHHFFPDAAERLTKGAHGALVDTKLCMLLLNQATSEFQFDSWEDVFKLSAGIE